MEKEKVKMIGRIQGTGSYVPEKALDNNDLAKFIDTNDEWIRERTGIVRRHVIEEDTTVSMAAKAAQLALENAGITAEEIDIILLSLPGFITIPEHIFLSCKQKRRAV